jgi:hypothetical protein
MVRAVALVAQDRMTRPLSTFPGPPPSAPTRRLVICPVWAGTALMTNRLTQ